MPSYLAFELSNLQTTGRLSQEVAVWVWWHAQASTYLVHKLCYSSIIHAIDCISCSSCLRAGHCTRSC